MKQWVVFENVIESCDCTSCKEVYNNKPVYIDTSNTNYSEENSDLVVGLLRGKHTLRPATNKEILAAKLGAK